MGVAAIWSLLIGDAAVLRATEPLQSEAPARER